MKIKFLAKPPGTDYEIGQVAEFDDNDWVAVTYSDKYLREGIAEVVTDEAPATAETEAPGAQEGAAPPAAGQGRGRRR